jgi:hypothetical protein
MPTDVSELVVVEVILQSIGGVRMLVDFVLANHDSLAQSIFGLLAADFCAGGTVVKAIWTVVSDAG